MDPRTRLVFNVGQSKQGLNRPRQHWYVACGNCKKYVDELRAAGLKYEVVVLEELQPDQIARWCWWWAGMNSSALCDAERWWIAYGRACGWPLTNILAGGPGTAGRQLSLKAKQRISTAAHERWSNPQYRARVVSSLREQSLSPEARTRSREAAIRQHADSVQHERARDGMRASWTTERRAHSAHVARMRAAALTSEERARRASAAGLAGRGVPKSPEHRAKISLIRRQQAVGRRLALLLAGL